MTTTNTSPFPSVYEEFIYKSRYSRWIEEEKRRENWNETVTRYVEFIFKNELNENGYAGGRQKTRWPWGAVATNSR